MVKTVEASSSSKYLSKRNEALRKYTSEILSGEKIHYQNGFSILYLVVGDLKKGEIKATIDNYNDGRIIKVYNKDFLPTTRRLAEKYEEITKNIRSNFSLLERLSIPKEEWTIEK